MRHISLVFLFCVMYSDMAITDGQGQVCPSTPCAEGQYTSTECTATSDQVCSECTDDCGSGYYKSRTCNGTTDYDCRPCPWTCATCIDSSACTGCGPGFYINAINECEACAEECSASEFEDTPCNGVTNRHCTGASFPVLSINVVGPLYGPLDGGTRFNLVGDSLISADSNVSPSGQYISIRTVNIGIYQATVVDSAIGELMMETQPASETGSYSITLTVIDGRIIDTNRTFEYRNNTVVYNFEPREHLFDGGTLVNFTGANMDSVANPGISTTVVITRWNDTYSSYSTYTSDSNVENCSVIDSSLVQCPMPVVEIPPDLRNFEIQPDVKNGTTNSSVPGVAAFVSPNGRDRADVYMALILDGIVRYRNISDQLPDARVSFFGRPRLNCSTDFTFNPNTETVLAIKGSELTRANRLVDVKVRIGDGVCTVTRLTDNEIVCQPPIKAPSAKNSSFCTKDGSLAVEVFIGYAEYHCSCLQYQSFEVNIPLIVGIVVGLGGGIIVIYSVACVVAVCVRKQRKHIRAKPTNSYTYDRTLRHPAASDHEMTISAYSNDSLN